MAYKVNFYTISQRITSFFMCGVLIITCLVVKPPKAKAIAGFDDAALLSIATDIFLGSAGMSILNGDNKSAEDLAKSVNGLLYNFCQSEYAKPVGEVFTSLVIDGISFSPTDGFVYFNDVASRLFSKLGDWALDELGLTAGGGSVPYSLSLGSDRILFGGEIRSLPVVFLNSVPMYASTSSSNYRYYRDWEQFSAPLAVSSYPCLLFSFCDGAFAYYGDSADNFSFYTNGEMDTRYSAGSAFTKLSFVRFNDNWQVAFCHGGNSWSTMTLTGDSHFGVFADYLEHVYNEYSVGGVNPALSLEVPDELHYADTDAMEDGQAIAVATGYTGSSMQDFFNHLNELAASNALANALSKPMIVDGQSGDVPVTGDDTGDISWTKDLLGWLSDTKAAILGIPDALTGVKDAVLGIPKTIAEAIKGVLTAVFVPDQALVDEIAATVKPKFAWWGDLKTIMLPVFNLDPDAEPPCIYMHLENAEGNVNYGGTVKALDLAWYARYKPTVDTLLSGFLWLAFLWHLFKQAPSILHGGAMIYDDSQKAISTGSDGKKGKRG